MGQNANQNGNIWVESILRKYLSGADIEAACKRLLQQSSNSSNTERKRVLNNCITLFKNSDVQSQIEKMKTSGYFRDNRTLMKHIITEFHTEIFGPIPENFAEYILRNYLNGTDIASLEKRLSPLVGEDNKECKKILQNCLTLLQTPKFQNEIESIRKSEYFSSIYDLTKRIETEYFEEIYERDKRNYALSGHYKSNLISRQPSLASQPPIQYRKVINNSANQVPDLDGNMLTIVKVGRLAYKAPMRNANYIDKYQIYTDSGELILEVFTNLKESKLLSDESYRRAVFKELLSRKNLIASLKTKYIGEIKANTEIIGESVDIGEQKDVFEMYGNYTMYGYSRDYTYLFDYDALAAVQMHNKQQHHPSGTNPKKGDPR